MKKFKLFGFIFAGFIAACAGILRASWFNAGSVYQDENLILIIVSAVVLGGTSLYGGKGNVIGSFIGIILLAFIFNAINILRIPPYWTKLIVGIILISTVILDLTTQRRGRIRKLLED